MLLQTQGEVGSAIGGVFISLMFPGIVNYITVVPVITQQRVVYYRERASRTYVPSAYFLAMGLCEIPFLVVTSLLFSVSDANNKYDSFGNKSLLKRAPPRVVTTSTS
eukprot:9401699-Pyramimonas_sp.AAC.1